MGVTFPATKRYYVSFRNSDTGLTPVSVYVKRTDTHANVAPLVFTELLGGTYYFDITFALATSPDLIFQIDGGGSIPTEEIRYHTSMASPKDLFVDEPISQVVTDVWTADSALKLLGLMHENSVMDQTIFDGGNNLTSARYRIYNTKANALLAGGGGLLHTYTITATYTGDNLLTYTVVLEP